MGDLQIAEVPARDVFSRRMRRQPALPDEPPRSVFGWLTRIKELNILIALIVLCALLAFRLRLLTRRDDGLSYPFGRRPASRTAGRDRRRRRCASGCCKSDSLCSGLAGGLSR